MRALLKPPIGKSKIGEAFVTMLKPTGNNRIKVEFGNGRVLAVDRYRLFDPADRNRRISDAEFARLDR